MSFRIQAVAIAFLILSGQAFAKPKEEKSYAFQSQRIIKLFMAYCYGNPMGKVEKAAKAAKLAANVYVGNPIATSKMLYSEFTVGFSQWTEDYIREDIAESLGDLTIARIVDYKTCWGKAGAALDFVTIGEDAYKVLNEVIEDKGISLAGIRIGEIPLSSYPLDLEKCQSSDPEIIGDYRAPDSQEKIKAGIFQVGVAEWVAGVVYFKQSLQMNTCESAKAAQNLTLEILHEASERLKAKIVKAGFAIF